MAWDLQPSVVNSASAEVSVVTVHPNRRIAQIDIVCVQPWDAVEVTVGLVVTRSGTDRRLFEYAMAAKETAAIVLKQQYGAGDIIKLVPTGTINYSVSYLENAA